MKKNNKPVCRIEKHECHMCNKLIFSKKSLIRNKKRPFFLKWLSQQKELSLNPHQIRYITVEEFDPDENETRYFCIDCGIRYIADPKNKHKYIHTKSYTTNCFESDLITGKE